LRGHSLFFRGSSNTFLNLQRNLHLLFLLYWMTPLITPGTVWLGRAGVAAKLVQQFMKTKLKLFQARMFCAVALGIGSSFSLSATAADSADTAPAKTSIPWSQIGAKAGADYQGDGLAVSPTAEGARLRCVFQRLEGEATREGLGLTSAYYQKLLTRMNLPASRLFPDHF
jgi:hypothetical protein